MNHSFASIVHFRASALIRIITMTLLLCYWSAPGTNGLGSSGISHN